MPKRSETDRLSARPIRRAALVLAAVAFLVLLASIAGQQLPDVRYAALSAVLAAGATTAMLGALVVLMFAGSYIEDRGHIDRRRQVLFAYARRSLTWGVAAGGVGALFATALPARLTAPSANPAESPVAGWLVVFFAGVGVGIGILEEWRLRVSSDVIERAADVSDDASERDVP